MKLTIFNRLVIDIHTRTPDNIRYKKCADNRIKQHLCVQCGNKTVKHVIKGEAVWYRKCKRCRNKESQNKKLNYPF